MNNITKNKNRDDLFREFMTPFDRLFDEFFQASNPGLQVKYGGDLFGKGAYPKVDIKETETTVQIEAAIPGMSKEDIVVEVNDGILTIVGEKQTKTDEGGRYIYRELKRSSFRRSWSLNENLDQEKIEAKFENGMLYLSIPKIQPELIKKSRQIEIK